MAFGRLKAKANSHHVALPPICSRRLDRALVVWVRAHFQSSSLTKIRRYSYFLLYDFMDLTNGTVCAISLEQQNNVVFRVWFLSEQEIG